MAKKALADTYEPDEDGLLRELVGPWVKKKHTHLTDYVGSSRAARQKWLTQGWPGATYIDLFCGPGRARVRETSEVVDGSALAVWKETLKYGAPFSAVHIADSESELVRACETRLRKLNAPVHAYCGEAAAVVDEVVKVLNQGLHLVFLDPYNLDSLEFSILEKFARFRHIDIIAHVSVGDGVRNAADYVDKGSVQVSRFAPGWESHVDAMRGKQSITQQVFRYWLSRVRTIGFRVSGQVIEIRNKKKALMYWLVHLSKHELADRLWKKTASDPQGKLFS